MSWPAPDPAGVDVGELVLEVCCTRAGVATLERALVMEATAPVDVAPPLVTVDPSMMTCVRPPERTKVVVQSAAPTQFTLVSTGRSVALDAPAVAETVLPVDPEAALREEKKEGASPCPE